MAEWEAEGDGVMQKCVFSNTGEDVKWWTKSDKRVREREEVVERKRSFYDK